MTELAQYAVLDKRRNHYVSSGFLSQKEPPLGVTSQTTGTQPSNPTIGTDWICYDSYPGPAIFIECKSVTNWSDMTPLRKAYEDRIEHRKSWESWDVLASYAARFDVYGRTDNPFFILDPNALPILLVSKVEWATKAALRLYLVPATQQALMDLCTMYGDVKL